MNLSASPARIAMHADVTERAAVLALDIARAATAGGGRRAALRAVLRLLLEDLHASLVACYVARQDASLRRAALVARDVPAGRALVARARRAVEHAVESQRCAAVDEAEPAAKDAIRVAERAGENETLVLPLETGERWMGLIVVWPVEVAETLAARARLRRLTPTLALALAPLLVPSAGRTARGTSATMPQGSARPRAQSPSPHRDAPDDATAHDAFLALLSHELRTPLNTLAGFLEIVLGEQAGPLTDRQREFLEYARNSAQRIAAIIEQARDSQR